MKKLLLFLICGIIIITTYFLHSCKNNQLTINYPEDIVVAINDSSIYFDDFIRAKWKVIQYINIDCSICIAQLNELDNIFLTMAKSSVKFGAIAYGEQIHIFSYYLDKKEIHFPVFIDNNNIFYKRNKLDDNKKLHTFFVDENNKIIYRGSLTGSKLDKNCFLNAIKQFVNR